jgi:hypothetical protein
MVVLIPSVVSELVSGIGLYQGDQGTTDRYVIGKVESDLAIGVGHQELLDRVICWRSGKCRSLKS